jgi:hypothetical protein
MVEVGGTENPNNFQFFGVVQGLSREKLEELMFYQGVKSYDFSIKKVSPFKNIDNIAFNSSQDFLEPKDLKKDLDLEPKSNSIEGPATILELMGEVLSIGHEIAILILVALVVFIVLFYLWILVIIPALIFIISLITIGEAWKMLRIHIVKIRYLKNQDLTNLIHKIHIAGGTISTNWLKKTYGMKIIKHAEVIRTNYIWFMKGLSITSYGLIIITIIYIINYFFNILPFYARIVIWSLLWGLITVGFFTSIYYVVKQYNYRCQLKKNLYLG